MYGEVDTDTEETIVICFKILSYSSRRDTEEYHIKFNQDIRCVDNASNAVYNSGAFSTSLRC
jgi:hypothetical protein